MPRKLSAEDGVRLRRKNGGETDRVYSSKHVRLQQAARERRQLKDEPHDPPQDHAGNKAAPGAWYR